jgi:1-aminocyclopropane-1-carboxylate deaminase/D-cysteine desulfhydrase-like pyridoxal-dependent ACC family enzyme
MDWRATLEAIPRISLSHGPTPLEPLPGLSQLLGRPVWIKRDDLLGPALGGNKTRKLEYLLAAAQRQGFRRVATFGGLQSNHARSTAAAAAMLGMQAHLFYFDPRPRTLTGNLHVANLLGATLHFIPLGSTGQPRKMASTNRQVRMITTLLLGRHAFIPVGGHHWLGALGYLRGAIELATQAHALGLSDARVICAAGTGGTLAGLLAGWALNPSSPRPIGIDIGRLWQAFPAEVTTLTNQLLQQLGSARRVGRQDLQLIEGRYAGPGYAKSEAAIDTMIRRVAQLDGLILDPVYTGKAMAGMIDLAQQGALGRGSALIFLHTGGVPGVFA